MRKAGEATVRGAGSQRRTLEARRPLRLDRTDRAFAVTAGHVDLFARPADGARQPLFRIEVGEVLFGLGTGSADPVGIEILAVGSQGCEVLELPRSATEAAAVAAWMARLAARFGLEAPPAGLAADDVWPALDGFHAAALTALRAHIADAGDAETAQVRRRIERDATDAQRIFGALARVILPADDARAAPERPEDPLFAACNAVGASLGLAAMRRPARPVQVHEFRGVVEIARASHLRVRETVLRSGWWRQDVGPLVAWRGEDRRPVAILSVSSRRYELLDPQTGERVILDEAVAASLSAEAASFYRPLPAGELTGRRLLQWLTHAMRGELARIVLAAMAVALMALVAPAVTAVLIDQAISRSDLSALTFCAVALAAAAIGVAGFQAIQAIAVLRFSAASDALLQAAAMDRLLALPAGFFKAYTVGDLTDRIEGVDAIRRMFTGRVIGGLLAGVFGLFSYLLMFLLDARLAMVAVVVGLAHLVVIVAVAAGRLRHERRYFDLHGKSNGLVVQMLTGIAKLRVAAATTRALAVWVKSFTEQKRRFIASRRAAGRLVAFNGTITIVATLAIFALAASGGAGIETGRFLAFFAAFGQALATMANLGGAIGETLVAEPYVRRLWPILAAPVEVQTNRGEEREISGAVELNQISFGYSATAPPVLDRLSFRVQPGEFVALVGPSGAGKSTIFRLLLGFETPDAGAILYDGHPLDSLDAAAIRRQIGVVLQEGRLISGSLYENICGAAHFPVDQVWEAVRHAGLDADIDALPMGLHTYVNEATTTLSGGQRQRLMIARALVNRPRLLLFDEATSALDNRSQSVVTAAMLKLDVTRIVIAHRLSTIRDADRIIVIDRGGVIQEGDFATLVRQPGLFADLAQRQLIREDPHA
jgi:NHLM bacteriocin system ABC transporter ATP-binding protein